MGVWHFVLKQTSPQDGFATNNLSQWHIPRYAMARNVERLLHASDESPNGLSPLMAPLDEGLALAYIERNQLSFAVGREAADRGLNKTFQNKLKKEAGLLEIAREKLHEEDGLFFISDARTPAGNPVKSPCRALIEAIAFERVALGGLDAGNFGIFSAYCTQVDFEPPREMPADLIRSLVASLNENGDCLWDRAGRTEAFFQVQDLLFSKPIWGPQAKVTAAEAEQILAEGMARLSVSQRVQFVLMEGMHGTGLLLPLCVVSGLTSFQEYASITCRSFQPDAPEEQDRRRETAFIKLFGELSNTEPNLS